jgi:hypothetical protein
MSQELVSDLALHPGGVGTKFSWLLGYLATWQLAVEILGGFW